jgi:sugar lactone lactonase YvrE
MQRSTLIFTLAGVIALAIPSTASADNGLYAGSGGVFSTSESTGSSISVQGAPLSAPNATASFSCPITTFGAGTYQWNWTCSGGSVSIASTDKSLTLNGTFTSGSMSFSGSGGGRGGHATYWYIFSGEFTGTLAAGGISQGVLGSISVSVKTASQVNSAAVTSLTVGWNSAYSPVVVGDAANSRLLGADNVTGPNLVTYGEYGTGTGQFESIAALARDVSGRIYIADSALSRLVRIDNLAGKNWSELGSFGTGSMHFDSPRGVTIDSSGKIWVADVGNNRIVRFNDMTGANWTAFGSLGTGANQFSSPEAVAFDAQGRIYVADAGNNRLVRFDDLTGKNWTTLSMINIDPYGYPLASVEAVAIAPGGQIYVATPTGSFYRANDMTGAGGEASSWLPSIASISQDDAGALYVAGGFTPGLAQALDVFGDGYFPGTMGQSSLQPSAVLATGVATPPPAAPVLSTSSLTFGNQNVGEPGAAQTMTLTNLGATPLTISSIGAGSDYKVKSACPSPVPGGAACAISVQFDPTAPGARPAMLSVDSNSAVHPLLEVSLTGYGTKPAAVVNPATLSFQGQKIGTASAAESATLTNTGNGLLTISAIAASGSFSTSNNCPKVLNPGNGCTILATFKPASAGTFTGALTITDDALPAGTHQIIALSGVGASSTPSLTLSPDSILFPDQQTGVASPAQTITLKNSSAAKVVLGTPTVSSGFKVATKCGTSLAAGASCTLTVQFAPTVAGPLAGTLTVPITGQPSLTVGLAGTGVSSASPMLAMSPAAVDFGALVVGDNPSMSLTLTNSTGLPAGIRSISLSGSTAFSITGNNCPSVLAGGASCTVQITFISPTVNIYAGTITIKESSGATTAVALSGSATLDNGN